MRVVQASLVVALAVLVGCNKAPVQTSSESKSDSSYLLTAEPAGAQGVQAARENVQDDEQVTLVGRIGGEANPWVEGMAAFSIVDPALKPCEEGCATPWDYCCDTDVLPKATATVKIVDKDGRTVSTDARQLLGVKELATVVVRGKARRDDAGNLTVLADGVYVKE